METVKTIETRYGEFRIVVNDLATKFLFIEHSVLGEHIQNVKMNDSYTGKILWNCHLGENNRFVVDRSYCLRFKTVRQAEKALQKYLDECDLDYVDKDWLDKWVPKANEIVKIVGPNKRKNSSSFGITDFSADFNDFLNLTTKVVLYVKSADRVQVLHPSGEKDKLCFMERCWLVPVNATKKIREQEKKRNKPKRVIRIRSNE